MQIGQSKPLNRRIKKPRQLWLSSILTLLIFATTISGYFLVQNSQDIRRSASEPYVTCDATTIGSTKCEKESGRNTQFICEASGWRMTERCERGCDGNICKAGCIPGVKLAVFLELSSAQAVV